MPEKSVGWTLQVYLQTDRQKACEASYSFKASPLSPPPQTPPPPPPAPFPSMQQGDLHLLSGLLDEPRDEGSVTYERLPQAQVNVQILEPRGIG